MGISTRVAITGEKEYRDALNNINSGLKVLNAEMTATSAKFKDNSNSVEALTAKNDVLDRTLSSQREKVQLLREQLKKSAETYGEGSQNTMRLQEALYKAEAQYHNTENAIKSNTEAMEESNKSGKGLGSTLNDLTGKFGIKLPDGVAKTMDKYVQLNAKTVLVAGGMAAAAAAIASVEKKLMDLTKASAAAADEILTLSQTTNMTAESIQKWRYSAELLDVSFDTISGSMSKLTANMDKARDGNEALQDKFSELGISVTNVDGSLRNAETVFFEIVDALGKMESGTERDAAAMEIFGKSAQELNPLINAGSTALREYGAEAEKSAYILSSKQLEALGAVDDAYVRLSNTQEGIKNQIAAEFAPASEKALTDFKDFILDAGKAFVDSGIVTSFGSILTSAGDLLQPLGTLIKDVLPALSKGLYGVAYVCALIADTAKVIAGLLPTNWGSGMLKQGLGLDKYNPSNQQMLRNTNKGWSFDASSGTWSDNSVSSLSDRYAEYNAWSANGGSASFEAWELMTYGKRTVGRNAGGTSNWRGGLTWVGEAGPELVSLPRGAQIATAQESRIGGDVYNFNVDAASLCDLMSLMQSLETLRMYRRKR